MATVDAGAFTKPAKNLDTMDVWGENQRGEISMKGTATGRLPSKTAQLTG